MEWHDFGTLEGAGWAANAVGGAWELYCWANYDQSCLLRDVAVGLLDHILRDGFLEEDGFIAGYLDTAAERFVYNFKHNRDWFCPGAMANIARQLALFYESLPAGDLRRDRLKSAALGAHDWLFKHLKPEAGWFPRRCDREGDPYPYRAEGGPEPLLYSSADGLYLLWLDLELFRLGWSPLSPLTKGMLDHFLAQGGIYGSINHDTYDTDESVAHGVAFRVLVRASEWMEEPAYRAFAFNHALKGLDRFKMVEDRNDVASKGLLYMEDSWDTAYLWENAECAQAYFEAFMEWGDLRWLECGKTILRAIAKHHHGPHGFLTEGVDWNNHVGRQHHFNQSEYGDIQYTEPLLNNLHIVEPTLSLIQIEHIGHG